MRKQDLEIVLEVLRGALKPYSQSHRSHAELPKEGVSKEKILAEMEELRELELHDWSTGQVSGAVYRGDRDHIAFMNEVYALNTELNPLHPDLWPRATRYEAEVVAMSASLLGATESPTRGSDGGVAGLVTSGGTESILTAVRCARDMARAERGIQRPKVVMPATAHPAFDKGCEYFCLEPVRISVADDGRADVSAMADAMGDDTALVVGSAPSFPWGVIDPIEQLCEIAAERGVWFHTDACLGGFILPFLARLGEPVPPFDFRLPGVCSISVDTHKYGYAAKGTSVTLFRNRHLRSYSYYMTKDWAGGLYNSPTMAGSRPGALIAQAWAALLMMGEAGYLEAGQRIARAHHTIIEGLAGIDELEVFGDSLFVVAFGSRSFDIYALGDFLSTRGWHLNGLQNPPGLHLAVTLMTAQDGVAERFLEDLQAGVAELSRDPGRGSLMAPIYGLSQAVDTEVSIEDVLRGYLDVLYEL